MTHSSRSQFLQSMAATLVPSAAPKLSLGCSPGDMKGHPNNALVLSGGTARGCYEAGVVSGLLKKGRMNFDLICGTSIGAINGALIAQGRPGDLVKFWNTVAESWTILEPKPEAEPFWSFFRGHYNGTPLAYRNAYTAAALSVGAYLARPSGPPLLGIMRSDAPKTLLKETLSLQKVVTPFMYVSTNMTLGRPEAFYAGPKSKWIETFADDFDSERALPVHVLDANDADDCAIYSETVRASGALTFVFDPISLALRFKKTDSGRRTYQYTDGGVLNNTPVRLARRALANTITAVFLDPKPPKETTVFQEYYPSNILDMGENLYFLTRSKLLEDDMNLAQTVKYPDGSLPTLLEIRPTQEIAANGFDFNDKKAIAASIQQGCADGQKRPAPYSQTCWIDTLR